MYAQVEKPKEKKSRAVANSVTQNKSNKKKVLGFVDNREALASGSVNWAGMECCQRKITNFKSNATQVDTPLEAYLKQINSTTDFGLNANGQSVEDALNERLPDTDDTINLISNVTGTYVNDGVSGFKRNSTISGKIGRAGRQQMLLNQGQEAYYQGGHLISHALLGQKSTQSTADKVDGWENIMAMSADLNNITYKSIETKVGNMTGPTNLSIDVKQQSNTIPIRHDLIQWLTGCPVIKPALSGGGVYIPNVIAEDVSVTPGTGTMETAEEIPQTQSLGQVMNKGTELMAYLESINVHYFMTEKLKKAVKKL